MPYQMLITGFPERHIGLIKLARPEAANALNKAMAEELAAFFHTLPKDCRVVVLAGEGKHFCAGADLKERQGMNEKEWHAQHHAFESARDAILDCPIPVIAAVNGAAMGGGLELALACDFIYAAEDARFGLTEVTLGIMPGMGGTQSLPRAAGMRRARELIFTGRPFSAAEAFQFGMVNKLFKNNELIEESLTCAKTIAANAPLAVKAAKKAMAEGAAMPIRQALQAELTYYNTLLNTKDRQEGITAFNQKRKPVFTGE